MKKISEISNEALENLENLDNNKEQYIPEQNKRGRRLGSPFKKKLDYETCEFKVPVRNNIFAKLELPYPISMNESERINKFIESCTKSIVFD
jgi:hypothetical protein